MSDHPTTSAAPATSGVVPVSSSATMAVEPIPVTSGGTAEPIAPLVASAGPLPDLAAVQPIQQAVAGEITEVAPTGCYVKTASGSSVLLPYQKGMTDLYTPKVGDFWVVYTSGYAFISPRDTYLAGQGIDPSEADAATADPNAEPNFPHYLRFVTGSPDMLEAWVKNWVTWRMANPAPAASTKTTPTTSAAAA